MKRRERRMGGSRDYCRRSGFTILEVLIALFVIGTATTVFVGLYTSSMSLARSSTQYSIASQLAEEYLAEIHANPSQFVWPNFADKSVGDFHDVVPIDDESTIQIVERPTAMPNIEAEFMRESSLYNGFAWNAKTRIHEEDSNFVELLVEVDWEHEGRIHRFYLTSTLPRSIGEGVGR